METNQIYLIDYDSKVEKLKTKDELWRLRVTREEFISKLEELRIYEKEAKERKYFNDYHIERSIKGSIAIMLMDALTFEEAMAQSKILKKEAEKQFAIEAPEMKVLVRKLELPLTIPKKRFIYSSLFRKQITLDDLQISVKDEFKNTEQYESLLKRKK